MKHTRSITHFLLALACSFSGAIAEDAPAPVAPAPPAPPVLPAPPVAPLIPQQPEAKRRVHIFQGAAAAGAVQLQNGAPVPPQGAGAGVQPNAPDAVPAQEGAEPKSDGGKKPFIKGGELRINGVEFNIQGGAVLIQGGARIQIQGGGNIQFQAGNVVVAGAATTVAESAAPDPNTQMPAIFLPGFPTVVILNPLAKTDPRPGYLGLTLDNSVVADDADPEERKEDGVGILSVIGDSPAEKAGLKEGDRVVTFEGKKPKDHAQLREMIRASHPEQNVKLTVQRDGKEIELKAKLGAAPDAAVAGRIAGGFGIAQNVPEAVPGVVNFRNTVARNGVIIRNGLVVSGTGSATKTPGNDKDTVTLRDGNIFTGKIRGITAEKGVQLQREGLSDLELIQEEITSLTFAERKAATEADAPKAGAQLPKVVLQMRDGSVFHGDALTMDHGALLLTLPAAQGETEGKRVEIPREHAQYAAISDGDAPRIYDGPTGLTGWSSGRYSNGQWDYKDGFLRCIANGPIGRDLGRMPDPVDVSFDVNYPAHMQQFSFELFSTDVIQSGIGALNVTFTPAQIFGTHFDGQRSNQYNTNEQRNPQLNAHINASDKPASIRYRVLVDRVNGRALIYVNGDKRAEWKLSKVKPEDLAKCGATFGISPHVSMPGTPFQIGHVRVMPWDGKEPKKDAKNEAAKGDQLFSGDGKVTDGTIDRITEGEIIFANPEAKERREKTVFIRFAAPAVAKELAPALALARLRNGGEVSAREAVSDGDALTLKTRSGPEVTVPLSALRELNFFPRPGQADVKSKNLDVLTLSDGTQFTGRAVLPFADKGVNWKIAASKTPLEFPSEKIAGIVFRSTEGARKTAPLKGDNALKLANGDWLQGEVVSLDGKQLVMKSDLAPALNFPVSELRAVYLNPAVVGTLADGATGPNSWIDGWNTHRGSNVMFSTGIASGASGAKAGRPWTYHDGSFTPSGTSGGQQMLSKKWPASEGSYAIHFEVLAHAQSRSFSAQIYNSKQECTFSITSSGRLLYVSYNPGFTRANRVIAPKNFQIEKKNAGESSSVRVSLVMDRSAKTFRVIMEGKEVGKIAFKASEAKEALDACGFSLSTAYSTTKGNVNGRVASLWLAPWSGTTASLAAAPVAAEKDKPVAEKDKPSDDAEPKKEAETGTEKKDAVETAPNVFLANGDDFTGRIQKITADLVTVDSEAGPIELPGKRVAWIRFPSPERPSAEHFPRLRFHDRGLLSVNDLHISDDRVKCKTLDGQLLDFPLNVVKEVVWRPLDGK